MQLFQLWNHRVRVCFAMVAAVSALECTALRAADIEFESMKAAEENAALASAETVIVDDASLSMMDNAAPCATCPCSCYPDSTWSGYFTQTVDYGTNLQLPINLNPAGSFLSSFAGPNSGQFLTQLPITGVGVLDSLGGLLSILNPVTNPPGFQDDFQFQTNTGFQRTTKLNDTDSFMGGYSYYQSLHPRVEQLNLIAHTINAQYQEAWNDVTTLTVNYNFAYYFVDSLSFVSQNSTGVGLLRQYGDVWGGEIGGYYVNANFRTDSTLDSNTYFGKAAIYRYRSAENHTDYLTLGYLGGYSDATAVYFTYAPNTVYAGGNWQVGSSGKNTLKTIFTYGNYDFQGATPSLPGTVRNDNLYTFNAWLGHKWNDNLTLFSSYYLQSNQTNIPDNSYTMNLVSLGLSYAR